MKEAESIFIQLVSAGVFSIDENGVIWRMTRLVNNQNMDGQIEKPLPAPRKMGHDSGWGYLQFTFFWEKKAYYVAAHRAVWIHANKREVPDGLIVNHIDGNTKNNRPDNLEAITQLENIIHAAKVLKNLGTGDSRGEKNGQAKLKTEDIIQIRLLDSRHEMSRAELARKYHTHPQHITSICSRKRWGHIA